jgi:membrane protease subunit (stomatin/prohibitin family)
MGFVDKLRAEFVDIIEWVDDNRNTLVWRFPRYQNEIKNGARLIVRPGQLAMFVDRGRLADVFQPGTYELTTKNLPLLTTLRSWEFGFNSPFKCEVYFVATHQITELKWGTPHPVLLRDPTIGPVRVRAFGTYAIKASNPEALLKELVGTDGSFEADEIDVLLRSFIASEFSRIVASSEISVMDLASNYGRIGEEVRRAVLAHLEHEYGLDLPQLVIVNISVPDEVEKAVDAKSSMGVLGNDLDRYLDYQLGSSIPTAAGNPAGGLAGAGMGVGMGMAIAGVAPMKAPLPLVPPSPETDPVVWHVALSGRTFGPYSAGQLRDSIRSGQLNAESMVWTVGMEGWRRLDQVARLAMFLGAFPPPPPPPPPGV